MPFHFSYLKRGFFFLFFFLEMRFFFHFFCCVPEETLADTTPLFFPLVQEFTSWRITSQYNCKNVRSCTSMINKVLQTLSRCQRNFFYWYSYVKSLIKKNSYVKSMNKENNKTQSGHCGVYSRLLGKSLMPFHFSNLQRRIFFSFCVFCNRFWTNRWRIHFGGAPCQDRVRHHFFGSMIFLEMRFFPFLLLRSWRNARRHDSTVFFSAGPRVHVLKDNQ